MVAHQYFQVHPKFQSTSILLNRQLYVNMGVDRGGLVLLDGTVCTTK